MDVVAMNAREEYVRSEGWCNCSCHDKGFSGRACVLPCCFACPGCGERVRLSAFKGHVLKYCAVNFPPPLLIDMSVWLKAPRKKPARVSDVKSP